MHLFLIQKDLYAFSSFFSSFLLRCQNQPRGSLITMGVSSAFGAVRRYSCWTNLKLRLANEWERTVVHDTHFVPVAILVHPSSPAIPVPPERIADDIDPFHELNSINSQANRSFSASSMGTRYNLAH